MGRPNGVSRGPLEPDHWPDWVLSFGGGNFPDDKVRQAARMVEFRQWQQDRTDSFDDHGLKVDLRDCNEEHRRRARQPHPLAPES